MTTLLLICIFGALAVVNIKIGRWNFGKGRRILGAISVAGAVCAALLLIAAASR